MINIKYMYEVTVIMTYLLSEKSKMFLSEGLM